MVARSKMNQNKVVVFFLFLFFHLGIYSQNKIREKSYFEGAYSEVVAYPQFSPYKISSSYTNTENNINNRSNVIGNLTNHYGTHEQKVASWIAFENAPKPKLDGQNVSLFYESVFKSGVGLGISVNSSNFQAKDIRPDKSNAIFNLGLLTRELPNFPSYDMNHLIAYEILLPYQTYNDNSFLHMRYLSFQLGYHFLESSTFDPYVRVGFGLGRERFTDSYLVQSNLTLGSRILLHDQFYLMVEVIGNQYDSHKKTPSPTTANLFREKLDHIWSLKEYSAKFGVGISY